MVEKVVTFTANPSIDRTLLLDRELIRGDVLRAQSVTEQAAGKGVNVARVVSAGGIPVTIVAAVVDVAYQGLAAQATPPLTILGQPLGAGQRVRVNTTVSEPDGTTTKLNEPGPTLTPELLGAAGEKLVEASRGASWVALAGSLPPGAPHDWYFRLIGQLRATGCRVAVDTSGAALDAVIAGLPDVGFDLIKPNSDELAQLTGGDALAFEEAAARGEMTEIVQAARRLRERGIANVLVTLGGSGAVLVNGEGAWFARPPRITVRSTVGAGDSSVAGFILAEVRGEPAAACLASAVAYGSAAASLPGTGLPTPADLTGGPIEVSVID